MQGIPTADDPDRFELLPPERVPLGTKEHDHAVRLLGALLRAADNPAGPLPIGPAPNGKPRPREAAGETA